MEERLIQGVAVPGGGQNKVLKDYWTSVELAGFSYISDWGKEERVSLSFCDTSMVVFVIANGV